MGKAQAVHERIKGTRNVQVNCCYLNHKRADTAQGPFMEGKRHGFWEARMGNGQTRDALYVNGRLHGVLRIYDEPATFVEIRWVNGEELKRVRGRR